MSCINIYHPDYIKLLSEIDDSINPFELPTLIRLYQKMNNTDKIPSVSEIYEIDNRTKSQERLNQIQDIFNEYPDFSSQIYEALGFKILPKKGTKEYRDVEDILELEMMLEELGNEKLRGNFKFQDILLKADKTKGFTDKYVGWRKYFNVVTDMDTMIGIYGYVNEKEGYTQSEDTLQQLLQLIKNHVNEFKIEDITPQQKQQATFMFSEFLDVYLQDFEQVEKILKEENIIEKDCSGGGKLKAEKGLQTNFTKGGKWKIYEIFEGKSHKQGGIDINIKNNQISFTNKNGSIKAKYGLVISKDNPNTKVKVNQNNQIKEYDISSPEYKDLYNSGKLTNYDKNTDTYIATPLKEVEVIGKKQYDYQGCVSGLCNDLAERNKMSVANFRQLNNLYGNAWEINKNNYGQDVDFTDFKNLKEGDIINLSRDEFKTDKEKGIPSSNQHIGYISKIEEGVPYVRHYISNVGIKSDGKTPYGEYFEEPINNIKEKFIYKPTGARRIDYFKDIDSQPSNFKYDSGYKPNQIEQDFASIHIDKNKIQDKLKLTNSEYDEIAKIAYGIMGNESSFGRSSKTLYRMALPDVFQKAVKVGLDIKRNVDVYDDNLNNLSQGYSSTKESSLYNISSNDGSTDFNKLNKRIKQGDYDDIERTGNYLRAAFEELGLNPDNLENGANSGKAIMATLAWYKKRNPNATTDDLLKMYTGKKNITKYKESFDNYLKNINSNSDDNLEYSRKDKMYGELSNVFNKTYSTTKELRSNIVGVLRDFSPLPAQYDALIADVLQGKTTITEKSLSSSNIQQLKEIVRANVSKNKFKLEYDDYQTSEDKNDDVGGGGETMKSIVKSFTNDAYILKTLLGQAAIVKVDDNIYDVIDSFDFNDKGKSFGLFDDLKKRGLSPYSIARSVGRNMGSYNKQGQQVKIRIKLD